ncbi:catabolite repressor/activator [Pseudomonas mangiferae]|uniref:Catabolite repressor/activator n=1 Tax=Pseudomonas mangiferae TaxID=2593654 RepID=A0A553H347_9PSED|nr:catabolite repressor/activator [Pseudomonas mangiferae]TRX76174.1 catabolite repressor/activator [Pseudomonas mangiferae]
MKLSDIARLAGVSVTTASYVINGQATQRRISAATVERVRAIVEQHGYRPDPQAAGLRRGQTRSLGFILPDLENPSYARLAKCLEQGARARGYQLLIASSDDSPDSERQLLQLFRARRCDGLIVASCLPADDDSYRRLLDDGVPVVAVDRQLDPSRFRSVVSDDREAGRRLTASLLQPRPRHIALLGARPELAISQARAAGFDDALAGFAGERRVRHGEAFSRACGRRLMDDLLADLGYLPDALLTTAYVLLEGVLDVLQAQAPAFPALRLGTFGDTQLLDFLPLRVDSLQQQHGRIAEQVLERVLAAVEGGAYQPGVDTVPRTFRPRHPATPATP